MKRLALSSLAVFMLAAPAAAQEAPAAAQEAPAADASRPPEPEPPRGRPSVVVDAKDDLGRDVRTATLYVDDKPVAYELDGKPIALEPGVHTVAVQRNDGPRQRTSVTLTLAEGDTNRSVHLAFEKVATAETNLEPPINAPLAPRIVAGVGVAGVITGVVLLLARPSLPANCSSDTHQCTRLAAQSDAEFAADRSDAASSRDLHTAGVATLAAGAGVTAAGVLWYVLQMPKPRTAMIAPWLQAGSGGVALRAAF